MSQSIPEADSDVSPEPEQPSSKSRRSMPVYDRLRSQLEHSDERWLLELARWYESDWSIALKSGEPPEFYRVLEAIDPERRDSVRSVLDDIYRQYHNRFGNGVSGGSGNDEVTWDGQSSGQGSHGELGESKQVVARGSSGSNGGVDATVDLDLISRDETGFDDTTDGIAASEYTDTFIKAPSFSNPSALPKTRPDSVRRGKPKQEDTAPVSLPGYKINDVLGRGGMGVVYFAHQEGIERPVALKNILGGSHAGDSAVVRFQEEAKAIGKFQHENIVRIYDSGTHLGLPYFALEFIDGTDLAKRINGEPIPVQEAALVAEQLANAMQYSHDNGVLHRDLKPANVLLTKDGVPKITDFGLAKQIEDDAGLSRTGTVVGTPAYMSPEQAMGSSRIGPSTDVYGLGAVLYCMLTGRPPFTSTKATDTLVQVINTEPVEPIALQPNIPRDLQTICLKALSKDVIKRYHSASELADDLGRFLRDEPILARPVTRTEKVVRWCRRNPKVAIPAVIAFALALTVMIGGPISATIINKQRKTAIAEKERADENALVAKEKAEEAKRNESLAMEAKEKADTNAEAAQVQEKLAIDALKSVTFGIQRRLRGDIRLRPLREDLLGTVRDGLERMEDQGRDVDSHSLIAATNSVNKGDLNFELGRVIEALSDYDKTLEIFLLLDAKGVLPNRQHNLSKIQYLRGRAFKKSGRYEAADMAFSESLAIRRQWMAEDPSENVQRRLVETLEEYGELLRDRGDLDKAGSILEEALQMRVDLHAADPQGDGRYADLMTAKMYLAKVIFQAGDHARGQSLMGEASEGAKNLVKWSGQQPAEQVTSALYDGVLARMSLFLGDTEDATKLYAQSASIARAVRDQQPNQIDFREALDRVLYGYGVALSKQGDTAESKQIFDEVVELRRSLLEIEPQNVSRQLNLIVALARAGQHQDAWELAQQSREAISGDDSILYHLACGYAQLADSIASSKASDKDSDTALPSESELIDMALESLRAAKRAGFYRQTDLESSPDLEPLRDDPRWEDILAEAP
ncbi:MAG: serine/threonine-protein kinase [Planctomycetota bacterium]